MIRSNVVGYWDAVEGKVGPMRQKRLQRGLFSLIGMGALLLTLISATGVGAQTYPPDPFIAVGCAPGDVYCYKARTGQSIFVPAEDPLFTSLGCQVNDYNCLFTRQGQIAAQQQANQPQPQQPAPPAYAQPAVQPVYVSPPAPPAPTSQYGIIGPYYGYFYGYPGYGVYYYGP